MAGIFLRGEETPSPIEGAVQELLGLLGWLDGCHDHLSAFADHHKADLVADLYLVEQGFVFGVEHHGHARHLQMLDLPVLHSVALLKAVLMVSVCVSGTALATVLAPSFENHQRQSNRNLLREVLRAKWLGCSIGGALNVQIDAASMYKWTLR